MSANPQQQLIIDGAVGHSCVVAGAGSGKTFTLIELIERLIKKNKVPLNRLFVSTFTNKAGNELKERLQKKLNLSKEQIEDMWIGTTHSLCYRFLLEKTKYSSFRILDDNEASKVMQSAMLEVLEDDEIEYPVMNHIQQVIELKRAFNCPWNGKKLKPYHSNYPQYSFKIIKAIGHRYRDMKKESKYLDFNDIIYYAMPLMRKQNFKFDWVIFDEAQDLSSAQQLLFDVLKDKNSIQMGDPKQSIYSFRGASPEIFDDRIKNADKVYDLAYNYRSSPEIINFANSLVESSRFKGQSLIATCPSAKIPEYYICAMQEEMILNNIKEDLKKYPKKGIAVLSRSVKGMMITKLATALVAANIPYVIIGGKDFLQTKYVQAYLCSLKAAFFRDELSFSTALQFIPGIGPKKSEAISKSFFSGKFDINSCPTKMRGAVTEFIGIINMKNERQVAESMLFFLYKSFFITKYKDSATEIREKIRTHIIKPLTTEYATMKEGLNALLLKNNDDTADKDVVTIITVHSSKGLEWDSVHVVNFKGGSIPFKEEDTESDWCLAYTAVTRAKKQLRIYRGHDDLDLRQEEEDEAADSARHNHIDIPEFNHGDNSYMSSIDKKLYVRFNMANDQLYHEGYDRSRYARGGTGNIFDF